VRLAHAMAMENPLITADMVEATEFPQLSIKYNVRGVPLTVINESGFVEGALPEDPFIAEALKALQPKQWTS
jgi:predicted DsbA family dithiol-disulfide isomerase